MKNSTPVFTGVATALITPLTESGVDWDKLGELIDWQIEQGINALVVAATTGEGSTLSDEEHRAVLKYAVDRAAKRIPIIAGTGSNETAYALSLTQYACEIGCDACLIVTPYYNKCTQRGIVELYKAIDAVCTKPIIVYNVPGRTGVNILPETYAKLAEIPHVVAIKEANGDVSSVAQTANLVLGKLDIYSGNDDQIIPIMSLGGIGVISVLSNILPKETVEMCNKMLANDYQGARDMQLHYIDLINALFCEVNPIPVKAAMAAMGFCENYLRLPLTTMEQNHYDHMIDLMRAEGLVK